jgi:hypothetical protein
MVEIFRQEVSIFLVSERLVIPRVAMASKFYNSAFKLSIERSKPLDALLGISKPPSCRFNSDTTPLMLLKSVSTLA